MACSILMPFCVFTFSMIGITSATGATRSSSPCTKRPEDGQGARKEKSKRLAIGAMEMKPSISGRRIRSCMPIQQPKDTPGDPAFAAIGVVGLQPVERRRRVRQFALAIVETALASPDAAKVEAQYRKTTIGEGVIELVDDLVVHRAAELRMGMQQERDGRSLLLGRVVAPLDAPVGAWKNHFRHVVLILVRHAVSTGDGLTHRRFDA